MPLSTLESTLLISGTGAAGLATFFYKQKKTVPFKVMCTLHTQISTAIICQTECKLQGVAGSLYCSMASVR